MKKVLLYSASLVNDRKWAGEFIKHEPPSREAIDTGGAPDWAGMVGNVKKAASRAGAGGVVLFLSGHGVAADDTDPNSSWVSLCNGGKVKITPDIVFYDKDPDGKGPYRSKKADDDNYIKEAEGLKTAEGKAAYLETHFLEGQPKAKQQQAMGQTLELAEASRRRRQVHDHYKQMGAALSGAGVARVVFLACNVGKETKMIDQVSKDWGVEVVAYKQFVTLQEVDGKVRLFLSPTRAGSGAQRAEHDTKHIPDITVHSAHVARPM